jgi:hypothetical protein
MSISYRVLEALSVAVAASLVPLMIGALVMFLSY